MYVLRELTWENNTYREYKDDKTNFSLNVTCYLDKNISFLS